MRRATAIARRSRKEERLEARVTPEQKKLIARAAALRGFSLTEFVVASAQQAASEAIKDFELLTLHDEARDVFVNAFLNPPSPNESARAAAKRYKERMGRKNPSLSLSRSVRNTIERPSRAGLNFWTLTSASRRDRISRNIRRFPLF
jgi:uncharacterized protein (DUF1778 family)